MMMGRSWNDTKHARARIGTTIAFSGIIPGISIARSVLMHTSKQARKNAQHHGRLSIKHTVSSPSLDVNDTRYSFTITGGRSYD
jgi:hypothetical protein